VTRWDYPPARPPRMPKTVVTPDETTIRLDLIYPMNRETLALRAALGAWREVLWRRGVRDALALACRHEDALR
jgi:hypothetical protein